jgi:hypothetical protein
VIDASPVGCSARIYLRTCSGARGIVMTLDEGGWRRPNVRVITPPARLRDVVDFFWTDEWTDEEARAHSFRIVADDAPHLLWSLSGNRVLRTQRMFVAGSTPRSRSARYARIRMT